ncbi:MAG TPA: NAD(P)-dependent oxidoreductase [Streptomyces sp.]
MHSILITGGAGFIGRHLARLLQEQGHQVTALDNVQDENAVYGCRELGEWGIATVRGGVGDLELMRHLLDSHQSVAHFAAPTVGVEQMLRTPVDGHVIPQGLWSPNSPGPGHVRG